MTDGGALAAPSGAALQRGSGRWGGLVARWGSGGTAHEDGEALRDVGGAVWADGGGGRDVARAAGARVLRVAVRAACARSAPREEEGGRAHELSTFVAPVTERGNAYVPWRGGAPASLSRGRMKW